MRFNQIAMSRFYILLGFLLFPAQAFGLTTTSTFSDFVGTILELIQLLIVGIFGLTFLVLIWGIARAWIIHGGDEKSIEEGKKIVTVGIIVLVIMSGLWGIVSLLRAGLFGL